MSIKHNEHKKINIEFLLFLFIVVFQPPIIAGTATIILITFYALVGVVLRIRKAMFVFNVIKGEKYAMLFLSFLCYLILVVGINAFAAENISWRVYFSTIKRLGISHICLAVCVMYALVRCQEIGCDFYGLLKHIVVAGALELCIVILAMLFPIVKELLTTTMIDLASNETIRRALITQRSTRVYGYAGNLFDNFGYIASILITVSAAIAAFDRKKSYWILSCGFMCMTAINARTGIVLGLLGIALIMLMFLPSKKCITDWIFIWILTAIILLFLVYAYHWILRGNSSLFQWLEQGINEVKMLFRGEKIGTFAVLFTDRFWFFPDIEYCIFGLGLIPSLLLGKGSDVGYVNAVWECGIVGLIMLLALYVMMFIGAKKRAVDLLEQSIVWFLILAFFVYMFKLTSFGYSGATVLTVLLCFKLIYDTNIKYNYQEHKAK